MELVDYRITELPAMLVEKYYMEIDIRTHVAARVVSHRVIER